jgi:protein associated with RNAse G/E
MKHTKLFKEYVNEAKESQYPQEVQDILKKMVDN